MTVAFVRCHTKQRTVMSFGCCNYHVIFHLLRHLGFTAVIKLVHSCCSPQIGIITNWSNNSLCPMIPMCYSAISENQGPARKAESFDLGHCSKSGYTFQCNYMSNKMSEDLPQGAVLCPCPIAVIQKECLWKRYILQKGLQKTSYQSHLKMLKKNPFIIKEKHCCISV